MISYLSSWTWDHIEYVGMLIVLACIVLAYIVTIWCLMQNGIGMYYYCKNEK